MDDSTLDTVYKAEGDPVVLHGNALWSWEK